MHHSRFFRAGLACTLVSLLACSASSDVDDDVVELEGPTNVVQSAFASSPSITSATPSSGVAGTSVTINGAAFGATRGTSNVYFRGNPAPIVSWSDTQIVCTVPPSATAGSLNLWVRVGGIDSPAAPFTIIPSISAASPSLVSAGAQLTINGANFGTTQQPGAKVTVGGVIATIVSWSMTKIVATVPSGASGSLAVVVTVNNQSSAAATVSTDAPPAPPANDHVAGREVLYSWMDSGSTSSADQILANTWPTERFADASLAWPLTWTENPYNDSYWRMQFYSFRPLRHLLAAWRATGNAAYLTRLMDVIRSFNSNGQASSYARDRFTTAMRGLFLVDVYWKVKSANALSPADDSMMLSLIDTTGSFLADPANYDSGNSNGLTESAALVAIATNFPTFSSSGSWSSLAQSRLSSYMSSAIDADGVVRERSPHQQYQLLSQVWEIARWANTHAPATGAALSPSITAMAGPATHVLQPDGRIPLAGASPARTVEGVALFDEIAQSYPSFRWSLSHGAAGAQPAKRADMRTTGWTTMRSSFDAAAFGDETQVFFDWRRASHSSNDRDLLNVLVYSAGRPLLVDSGMYSSEGSSSYGSYFRSTAAHNTIVVDGVSQSAGAALEGSVPTIWNQTDSRDPWGRSAHHTMYNGVTHTRGVAIIDRDIVVVVDHLSSATSHTYEQVWHLAPEITQLSTSGSSVTGLSNGGSALVRIMTKIAGTTDAQYNQTPSVSSRRGSNAPVDGWTSETSGAMVANHAVRFTATGTEVTFATLITSGGRLADATSSVEAYGWNHPDWGPDYADYQVGAEADVHITGAGIDLYRYFTLYNPGTSGEWSEIVDGNGTW